MCRLIELGERKSTQPMATRQNELSYDRLRHFISVGRSGDVPLGSELIQHQNAMTAAKATAEA